MTFTGRLVGARSVAVAAVASFARSFSSIPTGGKSVFYPLMINDTRGIVATYQVQVQDMLFFFEGRPAVAAGGKCREMPFGVELLYSFGLLYYDLALGIFSCRDV